MPQFTGSVTGRALEVSSPGQGGPLDSPGPGWLPSPLFQLPLASRGAYTKDEGKWGLLVLSALPKMSF